jgi:thiol-disulfide isomerase/thioredoxin
MRTLAFGLFGVGLLASGVVAAHAQTGAPAGLGTQVPMKVGATRPLIDFTTADKQHPSWAKLRGRVVVIDFWATWCTPCLVAFPKMNALKAEFSGQPVTFYSVTYETPATEKPVLERRRLDTTVGFDNDFRTFKAFDAWGIPAVYVFDRAGKLAAVVHPDKLDDKLIRAVLAGHVPNVEQERAWSDPKGAEWYFRSLRDKAAKAQTTAGR